MRPDAYLFAAATRGGSACRAFERMDRIFSRQGLCLQSRRFIDMPNNYLTLFKIPSEEEAARLTAQAREQAAELAGHILARQVYRPRDPHDSFMESRVLFPLLERVFKATHFLHYGDRLCADAQCTGCSLCSRVCLSGKIKMQNGRPVWDKDVDCLLCFACIHYCPCHAVQIRHTNTSHMERYHRPQVDAGEIMREK